MKFDRQLLRQAGTVRLSLTLTIGLGLLGGLVIVGQARLLSLAVSQVFLSGADLQSVGPLLFGFLALSLLLAGLLWGRAVAAHRVADRVKRDLREQLVAHLQILGPIYVRGERSGELINTAVEGIEALDAYFREYLPQLALAALVPLTILIFVFPLDWLSGLVLLLTAPLIPLFMVLIGDRAEALTRRQWTSLSRMSAHFLDLVQGVTTLKLFNRSREQIRTIAQIGDQYRSTTLRVLRVTFLSALVLEMVATLSTAVVAVQIGLRLLAGQISFQQGFFVLLLAPEFYLPLRALGAHFHAGMAGTAAAQRIYEVLQTAPRPSVATPGEPDDIRSPSLVSSASGSLQIERSPFDLSFTDVHYAYQDGQRPALNGLSFEIRAGQKVALVGPSGAGKSTAAYLLLRFIEPQRGAIMVNGLSLSDLSLQAWREQVAWVPQRPYLFYGTVADNIRLGRPAAGLHEVAWAARQSHVDRFIEALPQGYDTLVGERGARLSGGEAQRIALARAFLQDTPLLILDEATANLDPEIEAQIQESMASLLAGRTALVIAHRLATVRRADNIVVLSRGRAAQEGTHEVLLAQAGLYQDLVRAYRSGPPGPGFSAVEVGP
jgi:thiol reductant ABC exporter CydD subunit